MTNELLLTMSLLNNIISYVYTPKGSGVTAYSNSELSSSEITSYNRISDGYFTTDIRLANSSSKYNGHSFSFYKQRINNNYWIDRPHAYLSDGSYIEVSYSNVQPRDRIVYYNSNNEIVHSGVVRGTTGQTPNGVCGYANTVWVQSK